LEKKNTAIIPIGNNNEAKDVPIAILKSLITLKYINNGTINISAPPPTNDATIPVIVPININL
jgi:hypothetical protein